MGILFSRASLLSMGAVALVTAHSGPRGEADVPSSTRALETPGPRWGHTLVWDREREELLLFGGSRTRGQYLDDTWTWSEAGWERHELEGPAARGFAAAAFHEARGTIVLQGGRAEGRRPHTDTWEWDGEEWALVDESSFPSDHHCMVYLPETRELLAFGGWNGTGVSGETWLFDETWKRFEGKGPPPRSAFGMAYDAERDVAVLYGGLWINGQYADVWQWSDGGWQAASGPYDNSSIDHHSLVFDPVRGQLIGFGGKDYRYQARDSIFVIDGGSVQGLTTGGPQARHSSPLTWDGAREEVVIYGGKIYVDGEMEALGDMWRWDGVRWERRHVSTR